MIYGANSARLNCSGRSLKVIDCYKVLELCWQKARVLWVQVSHFLLVMDLQYECALPEKITIAEMPERENDAIICLRM